MTRMVPLSGLKLVQKYHWAQKYRWFENRLRCMSLGEIPYRFVKLASAILERRGWLTAAAVPEPQLTPCSVAWLARNPAVDPEPYLHAADNILQGRLTIFALSDYPIGVPPQWNKDPKTSIVAPLRFGKLLDYRDASLVGDIKYLWEPSRHLHLVTLAQAYALSGRQDYLDGIKIQLESWFDQCPYLRGPHWTSSLELGIRLINWSLVWQLIGGTESALFQDNAGQKLLARWLKSIYQHCHFIHGHFSRFSSANNHLIGEAAGLFIACITWPYWSQLSDFQAQAKLILEQETLRQNAGDGVNLEQATAYQQFVLDFLLLSKLCAEANGLSFSKEFNERIQCMLEFITAIMDVSGHIPMLGDADDGAVIRLSQETGWCPFKSLLARGAVLFHRADYLVCAKHLDDQTLWLLGSQARQAFSDLEAVAASNLVNTAPIKTAFPLGGYYVLGKALNTDAEIKLLVDAGPLGYERIAAHGHADALSFTLSVSGQEILIDPGTYAYHTKPQWRQYFRGTSAHNTVCIDGRDQSEPGGNFMWLQHAKARCLRFDQNDVYDQFEGEHDGYLRLPDAVLHRRMILLNKKRRMLTVCDRLKCQRVHDVQTFWHFSEHCSVRTQNRKVLIHSGEVSLTMSMTDPELVPTLLVGSNSPPGGWISRRFDHKTPTTTVVWTTKITGSVQLTTQIRIGKV